MWRPVPGYEGYYSVSDAGQVRSEPRLDALNRPVKGRMLRPGVSGSGYLTVNLWRNGRGYTVPVHVAVALAFLGERPEGQEVCHNDGDRTNNQVWNLRYDTRSANQRDAVSHGTNWQTAKTRCSNDHPFLPWNLVGTEGRHCKSCNRERSEAWRDNRRFDRAKANQRFKELEKENSDGQ